MEGWEKLGMCGSRSGMDERTGSGAGISLEIGSFPLVVDGPQVVRLCRIKSTRVCQVYASKVLDIGFTIHSCMHVTSAPEGVDYMACHEFG